MRRADRAAASLPTAFQAAFRRWAESPLSRRRFLTRMGAVAAGTLLPGVAAALRGGEAAAEEGPWPTLAAVQEHLFPSEPHAPGAREIRAPAYLRAMLQAPDMDADERRFILQGPVWLDDLARAREGAVFLRLDEAARERLLRQVAASEAGENWLSLLLLYLFEALLAAPAYGGNPDGIGWKWLGHQPGFPLPDDRTLYWELLKR